MANLDHIWPKVLINLTGFMESDLKLTIDLLNKCCSDIISVFRRPIDKPILKNIYPSKKLKFEKILGKRNPYKEH